MTELAQMFYDPPKVYAAIRERKIWLPAFVAVALLTLISSILIINLVGMQTITRKQLESNQRVARQMGQEKIDEAVEKSDTPVRKAIGYCVAVIGISLYLLVVSAIFMGLMNVMDAKLSYTQSLGTLAYSAFPFSLITAFMSGLILLLAADRAELNLQNLIPFNPAAFMDAATASKPLYALASSMDLLSFGQIGLIGFGYSKVSGKSFAQCVGVVAALWAVYVLLKTGLSALF
ncbi:MAG TPA: hypothetical protein DEQ47_07645 [Solibacterales bacterium]|jgi:hypothetical protein|nr:hypothetical protein [Bryobacterales bacterium]